MKFKFIGFGWWKEKREERNRSDYCFFPNKKKGRDWKRDWLKLVLFFVGWKNKCLRKAIGKFDLTKKIPINRRNSRLIKKKKEKRKKKKKEQMTNKLVYFSGGGESKIEKNWGNIQDNSVLSQFLDKKKKEEHLQSDSQQ